MPNHPPRQRATARLRIRQGEPSVTAPKIGWIEAGDTFYPVDAVLGDAVHGNANWFALDGGRFIWSGASVGVATAEAPDPPAGMSVNRRAG